MTVALLSAVDGSLLFSYKDSNPSSGYGIVVNDGLLIDSMDNIFISLQSFDNNWQVLKI